LHVSGIQVLYNKFQDSVLTLLTCCRSFDHRSVSAKLTSIHNVSPIAVLVC